MTYKIKVAGVVQGVGFRPYIYNEAIKRKVTGTIRNVGDGVEIITNEKTIMLDILKNSPVLSRIDKITLSKTKKELCFSDFKILDSTGYGYSEVPPDIFMCEDCLKEFHDKDNKRFYLHPFVSCTNCGPRFSITKKSPYDRINTSMSFFEMCLDCKKDYTNPKSRRYHAQTICCNNCGPKLSFYETITRRENKESKKKLLSHNILDAVEKIKSGEVVAVKGIGGFHLVCLLPSVKRLRKLTGRPNKPYAIMVKDILMAQKYVDISKKEKELLMSNKRPVVVLKKKDYCSSLEISELDTLGVMLPYTALHYLLFEYIDEPLVCTSSNYPDEPITFDEHQQFSKYILTHDRLIINRIDDSVIKVIDENSLFLRRSRGFVPSPIIVNKEISCNKIILALGPEMTNIISVFIDGKIYQSQYLGTISNADAYENYKKTVNSFLKLLKAKPDVVLCDLHPTYNSTRFAKEFCKQNNIPLKQIQHHVAHAYSVAIENNLSDFIAIACDGLGYGDDGKIWGGEIFHNDKRIGHLEEFLQIGGDLANMDPSRLLFSIMKNVLEDDDEKEFMQFMLKYINTTKFDIINKQLFSNINCPITSSTGRLFDAASYMLGFCDSRTYEGRGAMLLEAKSSKPYDLEPIVKDNVLLIAPLFGFIYEELKKKSADKKRLAATAQLYVAKGLLLIADNYAKENKLNSKSSKLPVVFSGGCAYNKIMTSYLLSKGVLINKETASGDGGISVGQIGYYLIYKKV